MGQDSSIMCDLRSHEVYKLGMNNKLIIDYYATLTVYISYKQFRVCRNGPNYFFCTIPLCNSINVTPVKYETRGRLHFHEKIALSEGLACPTVK